VKLTGVVVVEDVGRQIGEFRSSGTAVLEHVANRPIIHHVLDVLASAGVGEVVAACTGHLARDIRACVASCEAADRLCLRYVEQDAPVDLVDGIRMAAPLIGRAPCVVHLANGLLGERVEPFLPRLRGDADVVVVVHEEQHPCRRLSRETRRMLDLPECDSERAALGVAGVCSFGPGALEQAAGAEWSRDRDVDLTDVAARIGGAGGSLRIQRARSWHGYAGDATDLLELNRIVLDRLESDLRPNDRSGNRIEGRVDIHDTASVNESVIVGPAVIGAGARIEAAYIGPYTAVGAGARIENAEVERSIVCAGAAISDIGCRLSGSVIGRDARVFRDFSLPRALRLRVGDGTEIALS
jgi:glucose-1-phosphate thymidylyltransferase